MEKFDLLITLTGDKKEENNVTIAFTMAVAARKKGLKTDLLMLSYATYLMEEGYVEDIDIGEPFKPIKELMDEYLSLGGKISVCNACLKHNGIDEDKLVKGVDIVNAEYVIDALMAAEKTLQLN
ncbi:MAG: DsrE family protein [Tissierellia bacterium]|nr:DsrE family protein [Tissierellia bacterium]